MKILDSGGNREIEALISLIAKLPGFGPRSARRAVIRMLERRETILEPLAQVTRSLSKRIVSCSTCGNFSTNITCDICSDASRSNNLLCIVQDVADLWAIERSKIFIGKYHVLGNYSHTYVGINPEELRIDKIRTRIKEERITEIILALDATISGQTTANYLMEKLNKHGIRFSSLAHGVPVGGELDYLDDGTIRAAFNARRKV